MKYINIIQTTSVNIIYKISIINILIEQKLIFLIFIGKLYSVMKYRIHFVLILPM